MAQDFLSAETISADIAGEKKKRPRKFATREVNMKSNVALRRLIALSIFASLPAAAAPVNPADIKPLQDAKQLLVACTGIVQQLSALKTPADHAQARIHHQNNLLIAQGAKTHVGAVPTKLSPENDAFIKAMDKGKKDLDECSKRLAPYTTRMPPHMQKLHDSIMKAGPDPKEWSQADAKKVFEEITAYDTAHENFVKAVSMLSAENNQQIQSHLHQSILTLIKDTTPPTPHVKK